MKVEENQLRSIFLYRIPHLYPLWAASSISHSAFLQAARRAKTGGQAIRYTMRQLVLGFWWDSVTRTRTLEEDKLVVYIENLLHCAGSKWLTLAELSVLLGRMQRASMTMPQGSKAFLGGILSMISGRNERLIGRKKKCDASFGPRQLDILDFRASSRELDFHGGAAVQEGWIVCQAAQVCWVLTRGIGRMLDFPLGSPRKLDFPGGSSRMLDFT